MNKIANDPAPSARDRSAEFELAVMGSLARLNPCSTGAATWLDRAAAEAGADLDRDGASAGAATILQIAADASRAGFKITV